MEEKKVEDVSKNKVNFMKASDAKKNDPKKEKGIDIMELLNNPMAQGLLSECKDLFKKKESDPNILEVSIKGPSEAVLKLFKVDEK